METIILMLRVLAEGCRKGARREALELASARLAGLAEDGRREAGRAGDLAARLADSEDEVARLGASLRDMDAEVSRLMAERSELAERAERAEGAPGERDAWRAGTRWSLGLRRGKVLDGNKIVAIRVLREVTRLGLKEAKEAIEASMAAGGADGWIMLSATATAAQMGWALTILVDKGFSTGDFRIGAGTP